MKAAEAAHCGPTRTVHAFLCLMKQPETAPLRHIQFMDASGRKVPVGQVPDDWENVVLLVQQGASCRVFVALRGAWTEFNNRNC